MIVACTENGGIGFKGSIPWYVRDDLIRFRKITTLAPIGKTNAVIMGRNTWESLPYKPLKGRVNIVLSTSHVDGTPLIARTLDEALLQATSVENIHKIFVIGGGAVYKQAIEYDQCRRVYITRVEPSTPIEVDAFFPLQYMYENFQQENTSSSYEDGKCSYTFMTYIRSFKHDATT